MSLHLINLYFTMKKTLLLFTLIFVSGQFISAQQKLPVIRAKSLKADIRDGDYLQKGYWKITPSAKPDIYITSSTGKRVVFYTDIDSIAVIIKPDTKFDFIILLNDSIEALTEIKYAPGYLDLLKSSGGYNYNDKRHIPKFTYQPEGDVNLNALRKGFKLDSIAGEGNEISKILNLLHWVHNLIPHDGNIDNPVVKNALSMIAECKRDHKGLNCRGLATVLNECYLSMGIPSRYITCMPRDSVFSDCHVINMVYSKELKKWLWIDPTNDAYVMNEKGVLLSVEEVRDRLVNDKPLILSPEANWNHKVSKTKEEYLYSYMSKNLYRISCHIESRYDDETWLSGKSTTTVELIPLNGLNQKPDRSETTDKSWGIKNIYYRTNNPKLFWANPE